MAAGDGQVRPDGDELAALRRRVAELEAREARAGALAADERATALRLIELVGSAESTRAMMRAVTVFLRTWSGCDAVGIRLREGDDFPYYECNGLSDEHVAAESTLCTVDPEGRLVRDEAGRPVLECLCGAVIRGLVDPESPHTTAYGTFWTHSTSELLASLPASADPGAPRGRCRDEGYESVALVPLRHGDETFGLLQFNHRARGHFTPGLIALLERVAQSVAVAVARQEAEATMRRARQLESLGVVAGGIAHDFNNLLTRIVTHLAHAKQHLGEPDAAFDALARTERAARRASGLAQQLLTFAKGGAPIRRATPIGGLIVDTVEFALGGSPVACAFDLPEALPPANVDPGQVAQVFQNLAANAREAMPDGGTVTVAARPTAVREADGLPLVPGAYLAVEVADDGPGIAPHLLSQVFEPFYTTKETGTGLGLAVCESIVRKHEGHLAVESREGAGTTFRIYLPAAAPAAEPAAAPRAAARVLLMDDDSVREVTAALLADLGYEVVSAADGGEAVERYRAARDAGQPFDAVLLDYSVPGGMGGAECMAELRAIDPGVRAIVCSGYAHDGVMAQCEAHGFRGVVAKPYTVEQLDEAIQRALAGP